MRKVLRFRYYCEFCKKAGGSAGHMKKHEARCTANPARECGMCAFSEQHVQQEMSALVALAAEARVAFVAALDANADALPWDGVVANLDELRKATGGCPACILAALVQERRQRGVTLGPDEIHFDYKTEAAAFLAANQPPQEYYG